MVLPAGKPLRIFGKGAGCACVTLAGMTRKGSFQGEDWLLELPPLPCGGPYEMNLELAGENIQLRDVYVGHVYLVAGQSNVQFKMSREVTPPKDYRAHPLMRSFFLERLEEGEIYSPADGWVPCTLETIPGWSAIAYLTGQALHQETQAAVGVICCYQGASGILSWLPEGAADGFPKASLCDQYRHPIFSRWNGEGVLYHAMFRKVAPFPLYGVLWYQGESDVSAAEGPVYDQWLCRLVNTWRQDLRDDDLFFALVQIADYDAQAHNPGWAMIQQAQERAAARLSHCQLIVSRDVCASDDIHPPQKRLLAQRIARALAARL